MQKKSNNYKYPLWVEWFKVEEGKKKFREWMKQQEKNEK